ncbi:MAG: carbamoyltransferase, partial [Verrucomicrobia bacterium]|nr:carbamoyltransferase [Verrucomicrobiota bacterium]
MSLVLGINAYHGDSSAAIVRDGRVIAAVEEERFRRIKHLAGLPTEAMRYCLDVAGVKFGDLEHLAINLNPRVNNFRRAFYLLTRRPDLQLVLSRLKKLGKTRSLEEGVRAAFPGEPMRAQIHNVEHHLAHMASPFLCSPFPEAVNVSVDGFGDFASAAWGRGREQELTVDGRVFFPHSLGIFYSAVTQYLGFPHFGDEYKVMGLAPYGRPEFMKEMREMVRCKADGTFELGLKYFRHHRENVHYTWNDCSPEIGTLFTPELEKLLGPARKKSDPLEQKHKDLARSAQAMYEEAFFHLVTALHKKYGGDCLTLSGGCAMNSVANGKVYRHTPFKRLYIQSAAGDAGGAIGAAMVVAQRLAPAPKRDHMSHAYWGPEFSDAEIKTLLDAKAAEIAQAGCTVERVTDEAKLCELTAQTISEGKVVGWFQGRLEWGPRALGNR